jgi:hypothetical protein
MKYKIKIQLFVVFADPEFTGEMFDNQFGLKTVTVVVFACATKNYKDEK